MVVNVCSRTVMPANYPLRSCLFIQKMSYLLQSFLPFHCITYAPSDITLPDHLHPDPHPYLSIFKNVSANLDDISKVF